MTAKTSCSARFPALVVLMILLAALVIRAQALWLPHWRGDQAQYVILAMKLSHKGLDGYNLRGAAMGHLDASPSKENRIEFNVVRPDPQEGLGAYLMMIKGIGQGYYDEPLHVRAPLLPALLALSHRIWVGSTVFGQPAPAPMFAVLTYGPRTWSNAVASWKIWRYQLWAACIPLGFNLALIWLTAILAWTLFGSRRITIISAAILAGNPLSIWLAHKILTEDTATFFVTSAITVYTLLWKRDRVWAGIGTGVLAGLAVLTNQRTGLILPAIGGFTCICIWQDASVRAGAGWLTAVATRSLRVLSEKFFWAFGIAFITVTSFWFWKVVQTYGHPLYQPAQGMREALSSDVTGWFAAVHSRPHPLILFTLGAAALCPLFVFAVVTWGRAWSGITGQLKDSQSRSLALLWIWPAVFILYMANLGNIFSTGSQEHRYFYPAYPALAILAAFGLDRFFEVQSNRRFFHNRSIGSVTIAILLSVGAVWGIKLAYPLVITDQMLF